MWISPKITSLAIPALRPLPSQDTHKSFSGNVSHSTFDAKNVQYSDWEGLKDIFYDLFFTLGARNNEKEQSSLYKYFVIVACGDRATISTDLSNLKFDFSL